MRSARLSWIVFVAMIPLLIGGCTVDLGLADLATGGSTQDSGTTHGGAANDEAARLEGAVGSVQTEDPRDARLPDELADAGDTIVIDANVDVIVSIEEDLRVIELPDSTVVGFDNQTGLDLYIRFLADGDLQGVYVYDGETLLLDYPCLAEIELLSEDDIDPPTGIVVDSFDLDELYVNPDDFLCGDAVILPFEAETVEIIVEYVDLVE